MTATTKKVLDNLDVVLSNAETALNELEKINSMDLPEEEKVKMAETYQAQLKEFSNLYESVFETIRQKAKKGEKISYYSLSELVRKHRNFIYSILKIEEHSSVEEASDIMYNLIKDIMNDPEPLKKHRLGQLYHIALKKNLNNFKENVSEIVEKYDEEDVRCDLVSDFYKAYFMAIIEAVTKKFNEEIQERIDSQEALEEKRITKEAKFDTANEVTKESVPVTIAEEVANA